LTRTSVYSANSRARSSSSFCFDEDSASFASEVLRVDEDFGLLRELRVVDEDVGLLHEPRVDLEVGLLHKPRVDEDVGLLRELSSAKFFELTRTSVSSANHIR
jgi:hypothetical protein